MKNNLKKSILIFLGVGMVTFGIMSYSFGDTSYSENMATLKSVKTSWMSFPYKSVGVSKAKLLVEREIPNTIVPKKEYTFSLRVTNKSMYKIDGIILKEKIPENFKFIKADPTPSVHGNSLEWKLGLMASGQKEIITITGMALGAGDIEHTGHINVKYELGQMITIMEVIEPKLNFTINAPAQVVVNEIIPVECEFKNTGSAPVVNAVIKDKLPEGLKTKYGKSVLNINIGTIEPNITKKYKMELEAVKEGKYNTKFTATANDNIKVISYLKVFVGKPMLTVTAKAPSKRFVGNNVRYSILVKNTGNAEAKNVTTALEIPDSAKFISANEGGELNGTSLDWQISSMRPNETKKLSAILVGKIITTLRTKSVTKANGAEPIINKFVTKIAGIPALLLVLSDVNDPVPVGETETYSIRVKNQGSLAAENVIVECELERIMQYISVSGPTGKASLKDRLLVLKPLSKLEPGKSAEWKVTVKAKAPGDGRFKAFLKSKQLTRPVYESESTHFYK